ncbi:MAG: phosphatidate cytidylyltransferase [Duncaniella sp.]|nr:phosphatidate cytidylyltransferase [Duncaniella sp.]
MKNLVKRTLTGVLYVALIVCAVLLGGWWYVALFALFTLLAVNEFANITNAAAGGENVVTLITDMAGGLILFFGITLINLHMLTPHTSAVIGAAFFTVYLFYLVVRLVLQLYSHESSPLTNLAYSYMGQVYIVLPLGLMSMYYTLPDGTALLLGMFVMIWLSDTGAFCVGSLIGRHKLFPRISPAKTWEGFLGGVVFVVASALVMKFCFGQWFTETSALTL